MDPQECRTTSLGKEYAGKKRETVTGRTCQGWNTQSPHTHGDTDPANFPETSLEDAANYCRNPDDDSHPWCYTTDPDWEWDWCTIPFCEGTSSCKLDV